MDILIEKAIDQIIKLGKLVYDKGYNAGKDGNISIRVNPKQIVITTTGALLGFLTKDDCVVIDNEGKIVEDSVIKHPSTEVVLHTGIYKARPDINAVIHAHAPYCISLSMLDIDTENNLYSVFAGPVPITDIALPSTSDSWHKIEPYVKNRSKAILRRHGAVAWGKDLMTAFVKLEETEHFAKSLVNALSVQAVKPIDEATQKELYNIWHAK